MRGWLGVVVAVGAVAASAVVALPSNVPDVPNPFKLEGGVQGLPVLHAEGTVVDRRRAALAAQQQQQQRPTSLAPSQGPVEAQFCEERRLIVDGTEVVWPRTACQARGVVLERACPPTHTGTLSLTCRCDTPYVERKMDGDGVVHEYEWVDQVGECIEKRCPAATLVTPALRSFGVDRFVAEFAKALEVSVPATPQGQSFTVQCSAYGRFVGTVDFRCPSMDDRWALGQVQGGCRALTCPHYRHFSNGAMLTFGEAKSGQGDVTQPCPREVDGSCFRGQVTLTCAAGSAKWEGGKGECIAVSCDEPQDTPSPTPTPTPTPTTPPAEQSLVGVKAKAAPFKPEEVGFPLFYLVMMLWRNLGDLLYPTLFMIFMFVTDMHKKLGIN